MNLGLVWFRDDLRLADNPALEAALRSELAPVPIYIHAPDEESRWRPGAASDAWRHRSLAALAADLARLGSRLRIFAGPSAATLAELVAATGAQAVFWNRRYEPAIVERDGRIKRALRRLGVRAESSNAKLIFEPWELATQSVEPYRRFSPFWRSALEHWQLPSESKAPRSLPAVRDVPDGVPLDSLGLAPRLDWDAGFWQEWRPGEAGAASALAAFARDASAGYGKGRDRPDLRGTSRLSPHLHFGEISPWRILSTLGSGTEAAPAGDVYARELGWREFGHHVLYHWPGSADQNFNPRFDEFEWLDVPERALDAWRRGLTGVPIVDAGMRELWSSGWMHNRVRMIVASFLCKNLRVHWLEGARWFWDTLVDADLANNTLGWQWVAGTGVDAAPYFRVFNPVTQAKKFDPAGDYITRWVPELTAVPVAQRHDPWLDPEQMRRAAPRYPGPEVALAASRKAALAAYQKLRED